MWRDFWALLKPYWTSKEAGKAIGLLLVVIGLTLANVYIVVQINTWYNSFYNALQKVDAKAFYPLIWAFLGWAALYIVIAVYKQYLGQMLEMWWRRWMTDYFLERWLSKGTYYFWQFEGKSTDNPDQRIQEDIGAFISSTLGLTLGLLRETVTLVSFVVILWGLSGIFYLPLGGGKTLPIPGDMVWLSLIYAIGGTWLTFKIGYPLIKLNFDKQRYEADFRFGLVRLRENAEGVAVSRGELAEHRDMNRRFGTVLDNFLDIMKRQKKLSYFTNLYGQLATIFPFLVSAPRFFAGKIQLGGLMQTSSAFRQVQDALSFFVDAYSTIAHWRSVIQRLAGFVRTVESAQKLSLKQGDVVLSDSGPMLRFEQTTLTVPEGQPLLKSIQWEVPQGASILISGPSGVGKSTVIRTVSGIWPFVQGTVRIPSNWKSMTLLQKPYMPIGTLREALVYPAEAGRFSDQEITEAMSVCRLEGFESRLNESGNWAQILSSGEQQRVAFVRVFLQKPDWIFLDEASSAIDEATEEKIYKALREKMPKATLLSVGHRQTLTAFHDKHYRVDPQERSLVAVG